MNEHEHISPKAANVLNSFFYWCAGADKHAQEEYGNSKRSTIAGIGTVVFTTGILATISMIIVFHYTSLSTATSVLLSLFLGFAIFNVYRLLIASMGIGDGTDRITMREIVNASPRLLIAVVLSIAISAPIEVFVFQKEIDRQLHNMNQTERISETKKIVNANTKSSEMEKLSQDKSILEEELKKFEVEYNRYEDAAAKEISGDGCGPKCAELRKMAKAISVKIENNKKQIQEIQETIYKSKKLPEIPNLNNSNYGFLDRLNAINSIPNSSVQIELIRLLFILMLISPMIIKLKIVRAAKSVEKS